MPEREFYTAQDLADKLELNVMTIYRYIKSGRLKAFKFGKEFRIDATDYKTFLEKHKTQ